MNASTPKVSVCIPTYNKVEGLKQTLAALRAQTLRDFEILVCDDASSDATWQYLQSLDWPEVRCFRNEKNLNLPGTLKRLFNEARGQYVAIQHDHEPPFVHWVERMVAILDEHPRVGFACAAYDLKLSDGSVRRNVRSCEFDVFGPARIVPGRRLVDVLATMESTPVSATGALFRRDVVERAGGYRSEWGIASDEDLYRRVADISDVAFCSEPLFEMEVRPQERVGSLGQWRGIFTLFAFRADIVRRQQEFSEPERSARLARLAALKYRRLTKNMLVGWAHGDTTQLSAIESFPEVPVDAIKAPSLHPAIWPVAVGLSRLLTATAPVGRQIGRLRELLR